MHCNPHVSTLCLAGRRRWLVALLATLVLVAAGFEPIHSTAATRHRLFLPTVMAPSRSTTRTFVASVDAPVDAANPATNYGTATRLRVDGGTDPRVETYLRFSIGEIGAVQSARLRLFAETDTVDGPALYPTANNWTESGITWSNRPARGSTAIGDKGAVARGSWVEYDVSAVVKGNGSYSFVLATTATDGLTLYSSEYETAARRPQLVLTLAADPVLVGAGDIAACDSSGDEATARLLDGIPGTVFTAGDNVYDSGTEWEFANCYQPSWGRHKARTRPVAGNHDYRTAGATGYFDYFGASAGDRTRGYYRYALGAWQVIVLNSNCAAVGGCHAGSTQERWLRETLAAYPARCTLAIWHHPRFSSGGYGMNDEMRPFWDALYQAGADLIVNGHEHNYERFARQKPDGTADSTRGIRQFVVGTGGSSLRGFYTILPNSVVRNDDTYGVLKLTLRATSYEWTFVPVAGKTFNDSGKGTCH